MKIKILVIKENDYEVKEIENDYKVFNEVLDFNDAWNTPTISVRGQRYICICSDRGKIRHERVSVLSYKNISNPTEHLQETFIVGNVIITKYDGVDDYETLTDEDIEIITSRIIQVPNKLMLRDYYNKILIID